MSRRNLLAYAVVKNVERYSQRTAGFKCRYRDSQWCLKEGGEGEAVRERAISLHDDLVRTMSLCWMSPCSTNADAFARSLSASCNAIGRQQANCAAPIATPGARLTVTSGPDSICNRHDARIASGELDHFKQQTPDRTALNAGNGAAPLSGAGRPPSITLAQAARSSAIGVRLPRRFRCSVARAVMPASILEETVSCTH